MGRKITIYLEDADGQQDRCTGIHIERRNGTASWLTGAALDTPPTGSPRTWREIGGRARADGETAPVYVVPVAPQAPSESDIAAAEKRVADANERIARAAAAEAAAAAAEAAAAAAEAAAGQ